MPAGRPSVCGLCAGSGLGCLGPCGGLAGLVLGAIIGPLVWRSIAEDLGVLVSTSLPLVAGALVLLAVMGVAVVLALPPRWRAERLSLARLLRSE